MTIKDLKEALDLFAADSDQGEDTPVRVLVLREDGLEGIAEIGSVGFWDEENVEIVIRG